MMEDLAAVFQHSASIMQIEFTIYGFTLSFWDILIWSTAALIIGWLIVRFLTK